MVARKRSPATQAHARGFSYGYSSIASHRANARPKHARGLLNAVRKGRHTVVDVLLTHSYHLYYDRKQVRKMQPYPPLGTLYAAALLRQSGYTVAVFDTMLSDPEQGFREALQRDHPKIVVVYEDSFNFLSKMCLTRMREVAFDMVESARQAGAMVLANGSDASDHVADYLEAGALAVLLGEGEWSLLETVRELSNSSKSKLSEVAGIAYLDAGRVRQT